MKVTALGVNNAFCVGEYDEEGKYFPKWQSNFLLEFDNSEFVEDGFEYKTHVKKEKLRMVIDFGGDIRHSLKAQGLSVNDIDIWYCSHPHADHIGGVEGIALSTFFNPFYNQFKKNIMQNYNFDVLSFVQKNKTMPDSFKPIMLGDSSVLEELWDTAKAGLNTLQNVRNVTLDTYFNTVYMSNENKYTIVENGRTWEFYTVQSVHVIGGTKHMPSFGLFFDDSQGQKIFFPTDTMLMMPPTMKTFYEEATVVYQDCETGIKSGVHSHIDDIKLVDPEIKKKLLLYHYNSFPEVDEDEFLGVLKTGDFQIY